MESYQQQHQHQHQQHQQQHDSYMRPPPPPPPPPPCDPQFPQHNNNYYYQQQQQQQQHYPPPPQQNQWGPPPHQQNNWPPQQQQPATYPTHHPYPAPAPHSYPNHTHDWGNGNWTHHSGWGYPAAHSNEEDWAAKAKAWASARSAMDNQQPQSQYTSATQQEEPSPYTNQHPQPAESHFQNGQQPSIPTSDFSTYQGPFYNPPEVHQQEPAPVRSYPSESHFSFAAEDAVHAGDMSAGFSHLQGQTNSSVRQQEVPSSYSSIPGKEDVFHEKQQGNTLPPADDKVMPVDPAHFAYGNHSLEPMDQPLDFASRFSHGNDPKMFSYLGSSGHSWTAPAAPSASYTPIAPAFPSAHQHDHVGVPSLPGQHPPLFGTDPGFQSPVPIHVTLSDGNTFHPAAVFPLDAYGAPLISERPKKAAVPNWLREELIKTKATNVTSASDHFEDKSQLAEDELRDRPMARGDQSDSKSVDSAKSTEEDDEDEEDTQRTAAINQEIKRVLTEVLLKVTDKLFDEIATKVLNEDDDTAKDNNIPVPKVSPPPPPVMTPKASANVIIPARAKEHKQHANGETSSSSAGNVLGLANYASDEDDEIQASSIPKVDSNEARGALDSGRLQIEAEEHNKKKPCAEISISMEGPVSKLNDHEVNKVSMDEKGDGLIGDVAKSTNNGHKKIPDVPVEKLNLKTLPRDNSQERGPKRHDRRDSKRSSSGRGSYKETESNKEWEAVKDEVCSRQDERHRKKDKTEDNKRETERVKKERSPHHVEKTWESDLRKTSSYREGKDSKFERERDEKSSKHDVDRRREKIVEEKEDKSRYNADRHKTKHSSLDGRRRRPSKESPILSDTSSDEASDDSRRRKRSKKRNLSPSPVRSRRRDRRSRSRSRSPARHHRR